MTEAIPPSKGAGSSSSRPKPSLAGVRHVPDKGYQARVPQGQGKALGDAEVTSFPFPQIAAMQRAGGPTGVRQSAGMARSVVLLLWGECLGMGLGAGQGA